MDGSMARWSNKPKGASPYPDVSGRGGAGARGRGVAGSRGWCLGDCKRVEAELREPVRQQPHQGSENQNGYIVESGIDCHHACIKAKQRVKGKDSNNNGRDIINSCSSTTATTHHAAGGRRATCNVRRATVPKIPSIIPSHYSNRGRVPD